eukprot:5532842-Pleurochrysis_carterae.AAC.1
MTAINMLGALVMFGVVGEVDCRLVVERKAGWRVGWQTQVVEEESQINSFFGSFGGGDYFCFARG